MPPSAWVSQVKSCPIMKTTMISSKEFRFQQLLSSPLIFSPLWGSSGWAGGFLICWYLFSSCKAGGEKLSTPQQKVLLFQVVCCPLHAGRGSDHLTLCLAYQPTHASSCLCHGWEILCHLCHEHWIPILCWGDLSKTNQGDHLFQGVTHHLEGARDGSGPPDVDGQPSGLASHCLLGALLYINPSCHSTHFLFPEQAVREGTMDYHIADRPYRKHPR